MEKTDIWTTVHQERSALIDDLSQLTADQWLAPSLCEGWSVHDVLAHLVNDAMTTKAGFVLALLGAGFNFDRLNQRGLERERRSTPHETLAAFRNVSTRTTSAPAPLASRLVEIIVHGEDIRRPLGIRHHYPVDAVIEAMRYQLATSGSMGGNKDRAAGLRLVATDTDFAQGEGSEIHGTAIDLLLAITGRESGPDALTGNGVVTFRKR
jgi:uncharacterized protein (TIGR03083 family)